jgi:phage-related protein
MVLPGNTASISRLVMTGLLNFHYFSIFMEVMIGLQVGNNIFRVFCFFDLDNIVVIGHAFQKKDQKTPKQEIERAEKIKMEYYESKE